MHRDRSYYLKRERAGGWPAGKRAIGTKRSIRRTEARDQAMKALAGASVFLRSQINDLDHMV